MHEFDEVSLINQVIGKHYGHIRNIDRNDLFQAGYEGFLKAKNRFIAEKSFNGKFTSKYAWHWVHHCISNFLQKEFKFYTSTYGVYQDEMLNPEEEEMETLEDSFLNSKHIEHVHSTVKGLPDREAFIIQQLYLAKTPMTLKDIGRS